MITHQNKRLVRISVAVTTALIAGSAEGMKRETFHSFWTDSQIRRFADSQIICFGQIDHRLCRVQTFS